MALNESHFRKHKGQGPYDYMNFNVSEWNGVCVCTSVCVGVVCGLHSRELILEHTNNAVSRIGETIGEYT